MSAEVLRRVEPRAAASPNHPDVMFFCPGCKCGHGVWTEKAAGNGARWSWNGDMVKPTFNPSLLITLEYPQGGCYFRPEQDVDEKFWPNGSPTPKPHGRVAYSIHLTDRGSDGPYLDVSVMPRLMAPDFQI